MPDLTNQSRLKLCDLLRAYMPLDERDQHHAERILQFTEQEPGAALRETLLGHLTGSAWVVNKAGDKVLLIHHKKLGIWVQPGGHADGEYDLADVAYREASEETGLSSIEIHADAIFDVDIHVIPPYRDVPGHLHFDVRFVCTADDEEPLVQSAETYGLAWVPLSEVERYSTEASLLRMREKWLSWRPGTANFQVR